MHAQRAIAVGVTLTTALACATPPPSAPLQAPPPARPAPALAQLDIPSAEQAFTSGRTLSREGKHLEALAEFEVAAESYPTWALAHLEVARSRMVLNHSEAEILAALKQAFELAPNNPRVHFAWGLFHENYGRGEQARSSYRRAIALRGSYVEALYRLALLEEQEGDKQQALKLFERTYAADPDNSGAALGAARLAEALGHASRAEAWLRALVRKNPRNLNFKRQLVAFLQRSKQPQKARKVQRAIERAEAETRRELRPLRPSRR